MYDVGQIVFVISDKHKRVLPVRVVEQVVRKTLDGETVEYKVQGDSKKQTYTLSAIGANHFSSAEAVRQHMRDNATAHINEIVNEALEMAKSKYSYQEADIGLGVQVQSPVDATPDVADIFVNASNGNAKPGVGTKTKVKLPDGTYANVNVSIPGL